MFTVLFWRASAERAIKSAAQGAAAAWGAVTFTNLGEVTSAASAMGYAALTMGVLSLLTSLASAPLGNAGPSLSTETIVQLPDVPVNDPDAAGVPETDPADPQLNGGDVYPDGV